MRRYLRRLRDRLLAPATASRAQRVAEDEAAFEAAVKHWAEREALDDAVMAVVHDRYRAQPSATREQASVRLAAVTAALDWADTLDDLETKAAYERHLQAAHAALLEQIRCMLRAERAHARMATLPTPPLA